MFKDIHSPSKPRSKRSNELNYSHQPVMLDEVMTGLNLRPGGFYVDCTAGGGGHSEEILRRTYPDGILLALDQDPQALKAVLQRLQQYSNRLHLAKCNFADLPRLLTRMGVNGVNGILFDLGVSSHQLDNPERGFSYMEDAPLDMRMDPEQSVTAAQLIQNASQEELTNIIKKYGEERWASRIEAFIVKERQFRTISTTGQLVEIIKSAIPASARRKGPHPAKRTFQALRIAVNRELEILNEALRGAVEMLIPGGRICVISFHSLEDRVLKETFKELANPCKCPGDFPQCVCNNKPVLKLITKSPIKPSNQELEENPRSRSAKLRVAEKLL